MLIIVKYNKLDSKEIHIFILEFFFSKMNNVLRTF